MSSAVTINCLHIFLMQGQRITEMISLKCFQLLLQDTESNPLAQQGVAFLVKLKKCCAVVLNPTYCYYGINWN